MKRIFFYSITTLLLASIFSITSCDNKTENNFDLNNLDIELAQDDAVAEDIYITLVAMTDDEFTTLDENNYSPVMELKSTEDDEPFTCKVVTVDHPNDSTRFPKTITIDYGEGCTKEINGKQFTRKGKIKIVITGRRCEVGSTRTTTFVDFFINEVNVHGTSTVTCLGKNENGNMEFRHELIKGKLVFNDSLEYSRNSNTVRERVRSQTRKTDTIFITGEGEGINADGNAYNFEITERLMLIRCAEYHYQWAIVDGIVEHQRNGENSSIDYGDGSCGDEAILILDGKRRRFLKRYRYHINRRISGNKG